MKTPPELIEKIELVKNGDPGAFSEVYESSYKYLHTCVIHIVKNEDVAQDMLQDTYVEIFKNISQLKQPEDFLSWASTIANRKCFAYIKKDRDILVEEKTDDDGNETDFFGSVSDDESFIPENIFDNRAKIDIIRGIIDDLSDVQRACVIGFYYNDQKQDEIADQLGIPVNTVKSHLNRAKAKIKEAVGDVEKKQGIKLYSFAPFMLLLFAFETKAHAASAPAMGSELSSLMSSGAKSAAAGAGKIAGNIAAKKIAIAAIIGLVAVGGIAASIAFSRGKDTDGQADTSAEVSVDAGNETMSSVTEADEVTTVSEEASSEEEKIEENNEPEVISMGSLKEFGYDSFGGSYGGVLIVVKDGMYGAVDYDMNEIVPCEYEGFYAPNLKGYFILSDSEKNHLFDKTGKEIYSTDKIMNATSSCYIVAESESPDDWVGNDFLRYYDYNGNMILETSMGEVTPVKPVGEHDGSVLVRRYSEDGGANHCKTEVGMLKEDGSVTWKTEYDGPISFETNADVSDSSSDMMWEINAASSGVYIPRPLLTGLNDGYYMTYHPIIESGEFDMYDENCNDVGSINILYLNSNGDFSTEPVSEENWIARYYYDGAFFYNRGTKVIFTVEDRYILMDFATQKTLANYDRINMAEDDLWLFKDGDEKGFIDPDGNEVARYDKAADFYNGYAPVIKDEKAYIIDTDLNIVYEIGEAEDVGTSGDIFMVLKDDVIYMYRLSQQ